MDMNKDKVLEIAIPIASKAVMWLIDKYGDQILNAIGAILDDAIIKLSNAIEESENPYDDILKPLLVKIGERI